MSRHALSEEFRRHLEAAHREVMAAQAIAYDSLLGGGAREGIGVRLALNRCQSTLMSLLMRQIKRGEVEPSSLYRKEPRP